MNPSKQLYWSDPPKKQYETDVHPAMWLIASQKALFVDVLADKQSRKPTSLGQGVHQGLNALIFVIRLTDIKEEKEQPILISQPCYDNDGMAHIRKTIPPLK